MPTQDYSTHRQYVPIFHYVLFPISVLTLIGSIVNLVESVGNHERLYSAALLVVITAWLAVFCIVARLFALRAQDRAIRAEENLRYFAATGKLLDARLRIQQIIALRFAPDAELVDLARRAAESGMSADDIKKSVKQWRADTYRV
jgi:heme/copper-type cytochrome/quinol oxidase subunit 1